MECSVPYVDLDVVDRLSVYITYRRHFARERMKKSDGPHGACTTAGKTREMRKRQEMRDERDER